VFVSVMSEIGFEADLQNLKMKGPEGVRSSPAVWSAPRGFR
jgi:hypothetical protein